MESTIVQILENITIKIVQQLNQNKQDITSYVFQNYHDFEKYLVPEDMYFQLTRSLGYPSKQLQVEIVKVDKDLTNQVHYHKHADAYIYILGSNQGFPNAAQAFRYKDTHWQQIHSDQKFIIPHGEPHGFTVTTNGILYFLSIQTPPISSEEYDDYYLAK